jgi:ribosomal protein S18 acetylase RimI-like enzyme
VRSPSPPLRRLSAADAVRYREIRLEALELAPEAFGSIFAAENAEPVAFFADQLAKSAVFGAFDGDILLGVVGFFSREGTKRKHRGVLWGLYVRPAARQAGLGRRLVEAVICHARAEVEQLELNVVSGNWAARRLYEDLGFVEYGVEKNSLKADGRYWDQVLMVKQLSPETVAP